MGMHGKIVDNGKKMLGRPSVVPSNTKQSFYLESCREQDYINDP